MRFRTRDIVIGGCAVIMGHVLVIGATKLIEGADPVIYYSALAVLLIGVIQLVYVLPLVVYGLCRRRSLALGAGAAAIATLGFSAAGLLH